MAKTPEDPGGNTPNSHGCSSQEDGIAPERLGLGGDLREYYERYLRKVHPGRSEHSITSQVDRAMENEVLVSLFRDAKEFDEMLKQKLPGWRAWFDHD